MERSFKTNHSKNLITLQYITNTIPLNLIPQTKTQLKATFTAQVTSINH